MTLFNVQLTTSGFSRVSLAQIVSALNAIWQAAYGADIDLDPRSADGQIIGGLAEAFDDLNGIAADTVNLLNPNGATGAMLSNLLYLTGISRNAASYATAPATFTGASGTPVPTTFVVKSTYDGTLWSPVGAVTIGGGGTVAGTLRCQTIGPLPNGGPPMAGTLTQIITVTAGIDSVTNAVGVRGAIIEGDPNARIRRQQSTAIASQGMTDGLQAAIKALTGVVDAVVWENNSSSPMTVGDVSINPNTLRVVVEVNDGGAADPVHTSSSSDPIANTILALKSCGCGTQGQYDKYPLDALGVAHTIWYDKATPVTVQVAVTIHTRTNWPTDGAAQIKALISSWSDGANATTGKPNLPIGGDDTGALSWTDVVGSFLGQVPGFDFQSLTFAISTDGGSTYGTPTVSPANLTIPFKQFAQIASVLVNGA
jgi:hypothetical protein